MTNTFLDAKREWDRLLASYLKRNSKRSNSKVSERVQILLTVPKGMEQEFKDLAKLRREQADALFKCSEANESDLAIAFERDNPPPRRSDYE